MNLRLLLTMNTNKELKVLAIIPMITGPISVISSMTIIVMILRSTKALSIPYHRILFGLSIADILASIGMSTGSLLAPKGSPLLWKSFGNQSSCDVQGFIYILGSIAEPLYNCSLQLYYLCMIKYKIKNKDIQRKIEPFLLCVPILYGMTGAIVSLFTESINASGSWCYIDTYPPKCLHDVDVECTRGKDAYLLRILFGAIPFTSSFTFMCIAMIMLYRTARDREIATNQYTFKASALALSPPERLEDTKGRRKRRLSIKDSIAQTLRKSPLDEDSRRSERILDRIMQYFAAYLLANFFLLMAGFVDLFFGRFVAPLFILQNIFYPLQGFYNLLVFIHPRYKTLLKSGLSGLQAFFGAIQSYGCAVSATRRFHNKTLVKNNIGPRVITCEDDSNSKKGDFREIVTYDEDPSDDSNRKEGDFREVDTYDEDQSSTHDECHLDDNNRKEGDLGMVCTYDENQQSTDEEC